MEGESMAKTLLIGCGDPLRSDGGLGWKACEQVSRTVDREEVDVVCCRHLQPELAERVANAGGVIFVDACTDGPPGEISVSTMMASDRIPGPYASAIDPYTLLACAKHWYGRCPKAVMVRVSGECFGVGTELTPQVAAVLPGVVERVRALLAPAGEESRACVSAD
jgi:hydrogenase maturation protease